MKAKTSFHIIPTCNAKLPPRKTSLMQCTLTFPLRHSYVILSRKAKVRRPLHNGLLVALGRPRKLSDVFSKLTYSCYSFPSEVVFDSMFVVFLLGFPIVFFYVCGVKSFVSTYISELYGL